MIRNSLAAKLATTHDQALFGMPHAITAGEAASAAEHVLPRATGAPRVLAYSSTGAKRRWLTLLSAPLHALAGTARACRRCHVLTGRKHRETPRPRLK